MVLEELSSYGKADIGHKKYSKLLLSIAQTNIRVLYSIPLDKVSIFCTAIILNHSKIISFYTWNCFVLKPKFWWKHLVGAACKLQRNVDFPYQQHDRFFSEDEQKLLEVARGRESLNGCELVIEVTYLLVTLMKFSHGVFGYLLYVCFGEL